jgi:hypothetical protein
MKVYKQPDLNAPRYRPKKLNVLSQETFRNFLQKNPKYRSLTYQEYKKIVCAINQKLWETVIDNRDGVELPEHLGYLFIGTCKRKVTDNTDYQKSSIYGVKVQRQNWESDQYVAKIFYTNFEVKYRFKFHHMWGFTGVRDFKRTVAKTYPLEWKKYPVVDNFQKISRMFRISNQRDIQDKKTAEDLINYDEFDLD